MCAQVPPFSIQVLATEYGADTSADLPSLLPAAYRTEADDLAAPRGNVMKCVEKELDLQRLNRVLSWLWVAGRPVPPRPLHYQVLLSRSIFVTEQMDMHLVWTTGRIFLKPVPRFLLEPRFWSEYLCCTRGCHCSNEQVEYGRSARECDRRRLRRCALGFLFSYAALITHESDFFIAKEKRLLPMEVQWLAWRTFVEQLDTEHIYHKIDARFIYGELRLNRLNKIYRFSQSAFLRGYMPRWDQYRTFFQDNFAWLASATVYVAVVLTALQVGLATKSLGDSDAFQSASYGFTIFSILGPLIVAGLIILVFFYIFLYNWIVAVIERNRRLRYIQALSGGA
ncbi:hypothetical protein F5B22DRAFT_438207 [Xylaria bambusicola]|uniref:uncharacterized protein n=1 Tax=Xylaria bambusicola TaxID=326684 RepID=UPI0020079ACD|nr:uncharacterized protein F5B22DRAFT_438207 [Xylaria bambusicola]KAI0506637.1 hypothetical protein F5B22DRAFT_438207 [Xylaria bambusicola]